MKINVIVPHIREYFHKILVKIIVLKCGDSIREHYVYGFLLFYFHIVLAIVREAFSFNSKAKL